MENFHENTEPEPGTLEQIKNKFQRSLQIFMAATMLGTISADAAEKQNIFPWKKTEKESSSERPGNPEAERLYQKLTTIKLGPQEKKMISDISEEKTDSQIDQVIIHVPQHHLLPTNAESFENIDKKRALEILTYTNEHQKRLEAIFLWLNKEFRINEIRAEGFDEKNVLAMNEYSQSKFSWHVSQSIGPYVDKAFETGNIVSKEHIMQYSWAAGANLRVVVNGVYTMKNGERKDVFERSGEVGAKLAELGFNTKSFHKKYTSEEQEKMKEVVCKEREEALLKEMEKDGASTLTDFATGHTKSFKESVFRVRGEKNNNLRTAIITITVKKPS